MKNKWTLIIVAITFSSGIMFADISTKFNNRMKMAYHKMLKNPENMESLSKRFSVFYHPETEEVTFGAIVKLKSPEDFYKLESAGAQVHLVLSSGITTTWIPMNSLETITQMEEVLFIELGAKSKKLLDHSRPTIQVDLVHEGDSPLEQSYKGEDVIVGVIDSGIDYTHADFKDEDGNSRILYIWDVCDNEGDPPGQVGDINLDYGTECTQTEINNESCEQIDDDSHGTHVAGIAVGGGLAENSTGNFTGIAPESDIIIVKADCEGFENLDVINGTAYIFQRAEELGKPAVINMSLGGHAGPHDGTSEYEQSLDELTGNGKIIVAAAGNEGDGFIHFYSYITSSGITTMAANDGNGTSISFNFWYSGEAIEVKVIQADTDDTELEETDYFSGESFEYSFDDGGELSMFNTLNDPNNGDSNMTIDIEDLEEEYFWYVLIRTLNGEADLDGWVMEGSFENEDDGYYPNFVIGNNDKSVGDPATASNIIAVGAFNTKNTWMDVNEEEQIHDEVELGDIAEFSSRGPSRDGRMKPEISAPGQFIAAALTSDMDFEDEEYEEERHLDGGYYYLLEGTSMASPHVTGVVALLLQQNPEMDYDDLMEIFENSVNLDEYTGDGNDVTWGWGKINAFEAAKEVGGMTVSQSDDLLPEQLTIYPNYPNPFNPVTTINFYSEWTLNLTSLQIYDISGRLVESMVFEILEPGYHSVNWDAGENSSGIYFLKLTSGSVEKTQKLMLLK